MLFVKYYYLAMVNAQSISGKLINKFQNLILLVYIVIQF